MGVPASHAQQFPSRPIRIIALYTPGGPSASITRAVDERMRVTLAQPVIVENRPGAGSAIGSEYVAQAAPDGYTLLFAGSGLTMPPAVAKVKYDAAESFAPVSNVLEAAELLVVRPELPVRTVAELVAFMTSNP